MACPSTITKNLVLRVPFVSRTNRGKNTPTALSGLHSRADSFVAEAHVTNKFTEFKGVEEGVLVSDQGREGMSFFYQRRKDPERERLQF